MRCEFPVDRTAWVVVCGGLLGPIIQLFMEREKIPGNNTVEKLGGLGLHSIMGVVFE